MNHTGHSSLRRPARRAGRIPPGVRRRPPEKYLCVVTYDADMTAVRLVEGTRYGLRLYGFVLGITIVGGAAIALGAAVGWPAVSAVRDGGSPSATPAIAGGVLVLLGLSILGGGYLAAAYKLVADAVAAGGRARPGAADVASTGAPAAATEPESAAEPASADPNVGATADAAQGAGTASDPPAGAEDEPGTPTVGSMGESGPDGQPADPPEPSPEEIAFGTSGEDAGVPEPTDEPAPSASRESLAGRNASSDPLADPTEEE